MKNFDRIQKYLKNKMDSSKLKAFEKEIEENKDLALEVELQNQENLALRTMAKDQLKKKIASLDQKHKVELPSKKNEPKIISLAQSKYLRPLLAAASMALLILFGYNILKDRSSSNEMVDDGNTELPIELPQNKIDEPTTEDEADVENIAIDEPLKKPPKKEIPTTSKKENKNQEKDIPKTNPVDYGLIAMNNTLGSQSVLRGEKVVSITDEEWKNISINFNAKKYDEVILLVEKMSIDNPFYLDAKLKKAQALLFSSKFEQANLAYKDLISNGDEFIIDTYNYEMLLSLAGQLPSKKQAFNTLLNDLEANPDFTYQKEIIKLKTSLQKVNFNFE